MSQETHKKAVDEKHLEKLTIKEMREIAAEIPHERAILDMKKEELIAFIKEARGIEDETPVKKKKKEAVKVTMTQAQLKARIRNLKAEKGEALESGDKGSMAALRHRISRLKKKARRMASA